MKRKIIIALDFGYSLDDNALSSIDDIALATLVLTGRCKNCIVLAQEKVHNRIENLRKHDFPLFKLETGQSTTSGMTGGTWHALRAAKRIMDQYCLGDSAILISHELQFNRAQNQAHKIGLYVRRPKGVTLPRVCYKTAEQWWCRNGFGWHLRELFGYIPLKLRGQL